MSNNRNQPGGQKPPVPEVQRALSAMPQLDDQAKVAEKKEEESPEFKPAPLPSNLPPPTEIEPEENSEGFNHSLKKAGFTNPQLFKEIGKVPSPKDKADILAKLAKVIAKDGKAKVVATKDGGDYPPRVRRHKGEEFRIKDVKHFSFQWMKFVE